MRLKSLTSSGISNRIQYILRSRFCIYSRNIEWRCAVLRLGFQGKHGAISSAYFDLFRLRKNQYFRKFLARFRVGKHFHFQSLQYFYIEIERCMLHFLVKRQ